MCGSVRPASNGSISGSDEPTADHGAGPAHREFSSFLTIGSRPKCLHHLPVVTRNSIQMAFAADLSAVRSLRERPDWYPFRTSLQTREVDTDHQGHINNIAILGLHAEARVLWHRELLNCSRIPAHGQHVASLQSRQLTCRYLRAAYYPAHVVVALRIVEITSEAYRMVAAAFQDGICTSQQDCMVGYREQGCWTSLPAALTGALHERFDKGQP